MRSNGFCVAMVALLVAGAGLQADQVSFVNARGADGKLNEQAQLHQVRYMTWSPYGDRGVEHLQVVSSRSMGPVIGFNRSPAKNNALFISMQAPVAGRYELTLHEVYVAANRHLGVYVVPEAEPRVVIKQRQLGPDGQPQPDYVATLHLDSADLSNGRVRLLLQAPQSAGGGAYLTGLTLQGPQSHDEVFFTQLRASDGTLTAAGLEHDVYYPQQPTEDSRSEPWNLGSQGVGLGTGATYGFLTFSLCPDGVGPHWLKLSGIQTPAGILPGHTILRVAGQDVIANQLQDGDTFSTKIDVTAAQYQAGRVQIRVDPAIEPVVYIRSASLEPAGELTSLILPEQVDECIIWPLATYTGFRPEMLPPDPLPEPVIEMSGARHEWVHGCWNVSNFLNTDDESVKVSCQLSDLVSPSGTVIPASRFDLFSLQAVKAGEHTDERVYQALKPQAFVDVPRNQTRQMWLATRLPAIARPGVYRGTLTCSWSGGSQQVAVRLRVWNFRLPDESPLAVNGWSLRSDLPYGLKDPARHYFNVLLLNVGWFFHPSAPESEQPSRRVDVDLLRLLAHKAQFYGMQWLLLVQPQGSGLFAKLTTDDLQVIAQTLQQSGYPKQRWAMYPLDEYIGPVFLKDAKRIRSLDPDVLIFANRADDLHEVQSAAPYVDIWCPHYGQIQGDTEGKIMAIVRENSQEVWVYSCTGYRGERSLMPYRWQSWFAFAHGLTGIGTWRYEIGYHCGLVGRPEEVGLDPEQTDWRRIWSPRLLGWTDGIEDHMYLTMLQRYVDRNPQAPRAEEVRRMLDDAVAEVLADSSNPQVYEKWHRRLGQTIEQLKLPTLNISWPKS